MRRAITLSGLAFLVSVGATAQQVGTPLTREMAIMPATPVTTQNETQLETIRKALFGDTSTTAHFQTFYFLGRTVNSRTMCVVTANSAFENIGIADSVVAFDILTRKKDKRIRSMELFNQMGSSPIATRISHTGNTVTIQSPDPQRFSTVTLVFPNSSQNAIKELQSVHIVLNESDTLPSAPKRVKVDKTCTGLRFITMLDDATEAQMAKEALESFNKANPGQQFNESETSFCALNLRGSLRCSFNTVPGSDDENPFIDGRFQIVNGKPVIQSTSLDEETE
jgi:hypothetical protein